jgi:CRISPR-associated protein Cas5h
MAIGINKPVKKIRLGINLINTKNDYWVPKRRKEGARTQIRYEYIKDVSYRLYVNIQERDLFNNLIDMVQAHKSFYTVSLGLSELLADIKFIAVKEFHEKNSNSEFLQINSIVPVTLIKEDGIRIGGNFFLKERFPTTMDNNRIVNKYEELLIEMNGKPMELKLNKLWENGTERIVFI